MSHSQSIQKISVIVPENPFLSPDLKEVSHCLTALNVIQLMEWWPGTPHSPHRNPDKVKAIQRSLDWKRVAQIAAYLLQEEILNVREEIGKHFKDIYGSLGSQPGRQWPPQVPKTVGYERSGYPTFSNVLLHVNGAKVQRLEEKDIGTLIFDENDRNLDFSVIDGQHRINGAFLAIKILSSGSNEQVTWQIPSEIFLDLDKKGSPPRKQAQIFIDVNFYQKKVDRSLVADLFPTARGDRDALDNTERAQDLGRKLMLEVGPLVRMIQIPGIRFGVSEVVTLATINRSIEAILDTLRNAAVESLEQQAHFLSRCLSAWFEATDRREDIGVARISEQNVVYQGRVLGAFLSLLPACIFHLRQDGLDLMSDEAEEQLASWLREVIKRAGLSKKEKFLSKAEFKECGFLGSGGLARLRDTLWAAAGAKRSVANVPTEKIRELANEYRQNVMSAGEDENES